MCFGSSMRSLRQKTESSAGKTECLKTVVGSPSYTLLIVREGIETEIDDSGTPIYDQNREQAWFSSFAISRSGSGI